MASDQGDAMAMGRKLVTRLTKLCVKLPNDEGILLSVVLTSVENRLRMRP